MTTDFNFDAQIEAFKLEKCKMFTNRGFLVSVEKSDSSGIIFDPYMISNFSVDGKNIFITVYDTIQEENTEKTLDYLIARHPIFKERVKVVLCRLDARNETVYQVCYSGCTLKRYHGKNLTYKGDEIHQWYLEFHYNSKKIVDNGKYEFEPICINETAFSDDMPQLRKKTVKKYTVENVKKEMEILKNTEKMLSDAEKTVLSSKNATQSQKQFSVKEIERAKKSNEKNKNKLREIENELINQIKDTDIKINGIEKES